MTVEVFATGSLVGFSLTAAWFDLRTRRIPNLLSFSGLGLALILRTVQGPEPLVEGLLGAALALGITLPLFAMGALGGGDGKLLLAVGAFLGPQKLVMALLTTALVGGLMAIGEVIRRRAGLATLLNLHAAVVLRRAPQPLGSPGSLTIPYGVAIAAGAIAAGLLG